MTSSSPMVHPLLFWMKQGQILGWLWEEGFHKDFMNSRKSHQLLQSLSAHISVAGWGEVEYSENLSFDIAKI